MKGSRAPWRNDSSRDGKGRKTEEELGAPCSASNKEVLKKKCRVMKKKKVLAGQKDTEANVKEVTVARMS